MRSSPPSGEQYAHLQIGDRLRFGNDLYEVFEEAQRPLAYLGRSGYEKVHTFYVVLRRLTDGKFFRTLINQPDKLRQIPRPSGSTIKPRRRIPHFQLIDHQWHTVYDTDYPSLAARAVNRLLDTRTLRVNLDHTGTLRVQFNAELSVITERERQEMEDAKRAGKRYEKAWSIGMRYPWPPEDAEFGGYSATFNIVDRFGKAICSTESPDVAAEFWTSKGPLAESKVGLVISGHFNDPEDISDLVNEFKEAVHG